MTPRRALAVVGPLVLVLVLVWVGLWSPRARAGEERETELADLDSQEVVARSRLARIDEFEDGDGEDQLEAARAALPPDEDLGRFVSEQAGAARAAGVATLSVSPAEPGTGDGEAAGPDGEVEVVLSVIGERSQVVDHVRRLEELSRLAEVRDVSLATEGDGRTSASIRVVLHHLPEG